MKRNPRRARSTSAALVVSEARIHVGDGAAAVAVAAPALPVARAAFPRLGAAVASFAPHFSGELPPASFSQLVLGLYEARF